MSAKKKTVDVTIMGRSYKVACSDDERDDLMSAVALLDRKMSEIKTAGKVASTERIAVMAALNITHELIQRGEQSDKGSQDVHDRLRRLTARIDDTLGNYRQIEM